MTIPIIIHINSHMYYIYIFSFFFYIAYSEDFYLNKVIEIVTLWKKYVNLGDTYAKKYINNVL